MGMPPKLDGHEQNYGNIKITNVFSLMLYIMFQIL